MNGRRTGRRLSQKPATHCKQYFMTHSFSGEIVICMGSSCFSRGNKHTIGLIKNYLKERGLENTFVFKGAHCFGECENGPVLIIADRKYIKVSSGEITELLDRHFSNQ